MGQTRLSRCKKKIVRQARHEAPLDPGSPGNGHRAAPRPVRGGNGSTWSAGRPSAWMVSSCPHPKTCTKPTANRCNKILPPDLPLVGEIHHPPSNLHHTTQNIILY